MLLLKVVEVLLRALNMKSRLIYSTAVVLCLSLAVQLLLMYKITPWLVSRVSQTAFMAIFETCFWVIALGVVAVVLYWERQPLGSIGFRRLTGKEGLLALLLGILLFVLVHMLVIFVERVVSIQTDIMVVIAALAKYPIWVRFLLAARPAFVEEILYRGYTIERVNQLTGKVWPGALIGLVIFTALHSNMGLAYTVSVVLPIGIILTGLYVWKRNLTLNITVHFLIDFLVLVLLPLLPFLS